MIDAQSYDGSTPLMDACRFEINSMVEDLITTGAKVNMVDNQGNSPFSATLKQSVSN